MDKVEVCAWDGCLHKVHSVLIMETLEGVIPLTQWSLTKEKNYSDHSFLFSCILWSKYEVFNKQQLRLLGNN